MTDTAASQSVRFDFNNMMASQAGSQFGIETSRVDQLSSKVGSAHRVLNEMRAAGKVEWTELPYQKDAVVDVTNYARAARDEFDNFVVLGIGGSALGPSSLHMALNHPFYNLLPDSARGPRMFFLDNVDPDLNGGLIDTIDLRRTLFNVITKSGSTAETMSQFLIVRKLLRQALGEDYRRHLVVTTDPYAGPLRELAVAESLRTFGIPPGVGGRFSVMSSVGLLPAAIAGIDVDALLAGAAFADRRCQSSDVWQNPAAMNACLQFVATRELARHIVVMFPYAQALVGVADWFRQLWAESLGKRADRSGQEVRTGPTPVKALGTTDQHSQVQLYVEGPRDKVLNFIAVERWQRDIAIPETTEASIAYLGGHTLSELMNAEREATELAVTKAGQLNATWSLPVINAFTVGQLLYLLELQTAYAGELYDINAFDQPGVEEGKIATYALLGRPGYGRQKDAIEARRGSREDRFVLS